jgi:hypothetical protein
MRKTTKTAALAAALLMASGPAEAQDDVSQEAGPVELAPSAQFQGTTNAEAASAAPPVAGALRVYGGLRIGVGGGFKPVKPDDATTYGNDIIFVSPATPGIQVGAEYLLMKYFALGIETRLNWAKPRIADERVMLWDLIVRPRTNYQLSAMPLELYVALPFGLSISNWPEDFATGKAAATLGFSGGANYFFNSHIGLNLEMGWLWHWLRDEIDAVDTTKETFRLGQWTLVSANFMYAF